MRDMVQTKTQPFFRNVCKNLQVLVLAAVFALTGIVLGGITECVLYAVFAAAFMMKINIRYCRKNGVTLFLHWWAVMMATALVCYFLQWQIVIYILEISDKRILALVVALYILWAVITVCSVAAQVLFLLPHREKEAVTNQTELTRKISRMIPKEIFHKRIRNIHEKEVCPYCGKRCIPFWTIYQSAEMGSECSCPNCGSPVLLDKKAVIIKNLLYVAVVVAFMVLTFLTEVAAHFAYWSLTPVAAIAIIKFIVALVADLRFEEELRYPRKAAVSSLSRLQAEIAGRSFSELPDHSIALCQAELGSPSQKQEIREEIKELVLPELQVLSEDMRMDCLPPRNERRLESVACAHSVWGWDTDEPSELLQCLEELERRYQNF